MSKIKWIPGSENLFLAGHMDGSLVVYDKEKDDAPFVPEDEQANGSENGHNINLNHDSAILINKSVYSKNQKTNPVAAWKLSNQRINAFSFSPDRRHLAVVCEDGTLRIIDYLKEEYVVYLQAPDRPLTYNAAGYSICSTLTTADSPAFAGLQTPSTFSPVARTISSPSGQWPTLPSSRDARAMSRSCQTSHSILGDVMIGTIVSAVWVKMEGCASGTLAWECYIGHEQYVQPARATTMRKKIHANEVSSNQPHRGAPSPPASRCPAQNPAQHPTAG